jgi:hypothetical protein
MTNPLLLYASLISYEKKAIAKGASGYEISKVRRAIDRVENSSVLAAVLPTDIVLSTPDFFAVRDDTISANIASLYDRVLTTEVSTLTNDDIANIAFGSIFQPGDLSDAIKNAALGNADVRSNVLSIDRGLLAISNDYVHSVTFTTDQMTRFFSNEYVGNSFATFVYAMNNSEQLRDIDGHLKEIARFTEAYLTLRRAGRYDVFPRVIDVNIGDSIADVLTSNGALNQTLSDVLNHALPIFMFESEIVVEAITDSLRAKYSRDQMKKPFLLATEVFTVNSSIDDDFVTFTRSNGDQFKISVMTDKQSLLNHIRALVATEFSVGLTGFIDEFYTLADGMLAVQKGGTSRILDDGRLTVEYSNATIAMMSRSYIVKANSKLVKV